MGITRISEFWPEWKVLDVLGQGGYGKVYRAVDEEAGFPVYAAIKVISIPANEAEYDALRSEGMTDIDVKQYFKDVVEDFVKEIKLMNTLKSAPNVVGVEAFKILEKREGVGWDIYIRMELLSSFKDYLDNNDPTEDEIIKLGIDIATALEVCQAKNIIHRDIKPANIFITPFGDFKLGDFGIAKELEKTSGAVSSKGTYAFMAPEVARGLRYDATVDIYSLGLVLYSMLNDNRPPFIDRTTERISYNERKEATDKRLTGRPIPPPVNASSELSKIVLTACSFNPQQRFKTPTAFKNALIAYRDSRKTEKGSAVTPAPKISTAGERYNPPADDTATQTVRADNVTRNTQVNSAAAPAKKNFRFGINVSFLTFIAVLLLMAMTYQTIAKVYKLAGDIDYSVLWSSGEDKPVGPGVGDTIFFGYYEQDGNPDNGEEPIEWIVLENDNGSVLLVSKYGLDCVQYNEYLNPVTWSDSSLRVWLNSYFYGAAFSTEERQKIENTLLTNHDNPDYGTDGGRDTNDKVFLLSIDEVNKYFSSEEKMTCHATPYAAGRGAWVSAKNGNSWWWLRSPGRDNTCAAGVYTFGGIYYEGNGVDFIDDIVRPAIRIQY